MNRIDAKFKALKKAKRSALIAYLTAGDPNLKKTEALVPAFEKEGVDLIEIGVPFSDPLADGPVIQAASARALKGKVNLKQILSLVARLRKKTDTPLLLMTYYNPVYRHGLSRFAQDAKAAGVDGVIIPDLPIEEALEAVHFLAARHINLIQFLSPTSGEQRIKKIVKAAKGFIYLVSLTGVTGTNAGLASDIQSKVRMIRRFTSLPVCVGFGISNPKTAQEVSRYADGVIVGSAIVKAIETYPTLSADAFSQKVIRPFSRALGGRS